MARVLDGNAIAAAIKAEVKDEVERLALQGIRPGLAAVLVGHVPASEIYVRSKVKTCEALGLFSELITPPETVTTDEMLALIAQLNARDDIDGILIQLPLPAHVNAKLLLEAVSPDKDVDGFHPVNVGRLQTGQPALAPCTAAGIIEILKRSQMPDCGAECGGGGAQRHRGKTHRDSAAGGECDGHRVPLPDARSGLVHPAGRHPGGGDRQAGVRDDRDGQTGSYDSRRGHQPRYRSGGIRALFRRRCSPRRDLPAEGFDHCWAMCFPKRTRWLGPIPLCPAASGRSPLPC